MLTEEKIKTELLNKGNLTCEWGRNYKNSFVYELYLNISNCGYRIATYSIKTKRITLICPQIYIPDSYILKGFIELVEKKERNQEL